MLLILGHFWYWFGAFVFLLLIYPLSDDTTEFPVVLCYAIMSWVVAAQCARSIAEMCARWIPRMVFAVGAIGFLTAYFLAAYMHTDDHYILFYVASPIIGAAVMCMDIGARQVTADQTLLHSTRHLAMLYASRFLAAVVAGVYVRTTEPYINWKQHMYIYAFLSIGTLAYVAWFMPGRCTSNEQPVRTCCNRAQRHRFVVVVCIELVVSCIRWAVPMLLIQSLVISDKKGASGSVSVQSLLVVYLATGTLNDLAQAWFACYKWNISIHIYMLAAAVYAIFCFSYPAVDAEVVTTWTAVVVFGLLGYGTDTCDGIFRNMYGPPRAGGIRAAVSWINAICVFVVMFFVCANADTVTSEKTPDRESVQLAFYVIASFNVVVLLALMYLHFVLNQSRTYSRQLISQTQANLDNDNDDEFNSMTIT